MPYGPIVDGEGTAKYSVQFYTTQNEGSAFVDLVLSAELPGDFGYDELFQEILDRLSDIPGLTVPGQASKSWLNYEVVTPTPDPE